ncbi:DUF4401 domain-containing protein [Pseudomonas sp. F1_0610]|uniref:DUF4401 domain-containing protein n=1 Tax=Pseudomonas sp. F1_0610 TaxID=3114284 RepID=UPI0039C1C7CB
MHNLALWQSLKDKQLITADAPAHTEQKSIFMAILQGFSAWLAALFLGIACAISGWWLFKSPSILLLWSGVFFFVVFWLFRGKGQFSSFFEQIALALSLCAQGFFIVGATWFQFYNQYSGKAEVIHAASLVSTFLYAGLFFLFNNHWHRILSVVGFSISLILVNRFNALSIFPAIYLLLLAFCASHQYRNLSFISFIRPLMYGLLVSLILLICMWTWWLELIYDFIRYSAWRDTWSQTPKWLEQGVLIAAELFILAHLIRFHGQPKSRLYILYLPLLALILTAQYFMPPLGILAGLILIGFTLAVPVIKWAGLVSTVLYISWFYYSLQWSLFDKSLMLMALGAGLLLISWILNRFHKELVNA